MKWWRAAGAVAVGAAVVVWACGGAGSGDLGPGRDGGPPPTDGGDPDAGHPDAGPPDAGPDAGPPDAGPPDAGPPDAGPPDGGFVPPPAIPFPTVPGWSFLGPQHGGPHDVFQVSADQGGNIWVAGGVDGLFLLRPGATKFERFTIADGLHPYGYLTGKQADARKVPAGTPADPSPSLSATPVIAVEGGPPGVVFVGYQGKPGCEDNWDNAGRDPAIYKSGDADRVTLKPDGTLSVVHYDIFSGLDVVRDEPEGREKLCSIFRIVWNPSTNDLWFGGNHGFAWGNPNYAGDPTCDGQFACSGNIEHSHPAVNGANRVYLTGDYRGVAPDPVTGDVWFGGLNRTTRFHWNAFTGTTVERFFGAQNLTEGYNDVLDPPKCPSAAGTPCYINNRIDLWPDAKEEGFFPGPLDRTDDVIFAMAAQGDGTVYVGSGYLGLKQLNANGTTAKDLTSSISSSSVGALALDPSDQSLWVGNRYGRGIDRLRGAAKQAYALDVFGNLANSGIEDIQFMGSGAARKVLVGFRQDTVHNVPGFVAIYSGN
ncbi:MAG TPA: hypothetical protein VF994_04455 [Myxococcales bacterium]